MRVNVLVLLVMIAASQALSDATKETIATVSGKQESSNKIAQSRVKRGSYDMLRLTRGLNMLRLGKRAVEPSYLPINQEELFTLEDNIPGLQASVNDIYPEEYYKALAPNEDIYDMEPHSRYRRSTPSDHLMVTALPPVEGGNDLIGNDNSGIPDGLKIDDDDDDDAYLMYPEWDYGVGGDDDGGDKVWDEKDGEGSEDLNERTPSMLMLGKRQLAMLRLGKRLDVGEDVKRTLSMLRLGKRQRENLNSDFTDSDQKRTLSMLRLGKKRNLNMLRLGKRYPFGNKKLNMLRMGKKRNLNMLRLGKRNLNMLRLGKRNLNMLRLGKRNLNMLRLGKRNLNMLRLGKRQLNMLRLGKRKDEKRNLAMLRLGKREVEAEKRNLHMLRLGKRSTDGMNVENEE